MAKNYYRSFRRLYHTLKKKNSRQSMEEVFKADVLDNVTFQNHIKEVAAKLNIEEAIVHKVVTHYLRHILSMIINPPKHRRKILIYGFFYLEIINPLYNEYSYYSLSFIKKRFRGFLTTKSKRINHGKR